MIGRCLGSTKRSNVKLISLNLANNKITDVGMEEIAQVRTKKSLIYPKLWDKNAQVSRVDSDQMLHIMVSDQVLHCLPLLLQFLDTSTGNKEDCLNFRNGYD